VPGEVEQVIRHVWILPPPAPHLERIHAPVLAILLQCAGVTTKEFIIELNVLSIFVRLFELIELGNLWNPAAQNHGCDITPGTQMTLSFAAHG
jgi:hypothetical protein